MLDSLVALPLLLPLLASPAQDDDLPAPTSEEVADALQEAIELLVSNQEAYTPDRPVGRLDEAELADWQQRERERLAEIRADGEGSEWPYEGVYRVGPDGRIPPGYRVGGTAIVCEALIETPGFAKSKARRAAFERGVDLVLDLLENDPQMEPGPKRGYDVRGWGHTYALKLLLRALELELFSGDREEAVEAMIPHLLLCIETNAIDQGGWNYANNRCSPFMTGSTLLALFHAKEAGYDVDEDMVERALSALERARASETGAYAYSGRGTEPMASSAARAAIAELVLFRAGRSDADRLRVAVDGFFDNYDFLLERKSRQGTHEPPYGIAPYYFFYGHTYAALAIEHLPEEAREDYRARLRGLLWTTREESGGWNDRIFPRTESFSTAMAALALLAPSLPDVHAWK